MVAWKRPELVKLATCEECRKERAVQFAARYRYAPNLTAEWWLAGLCTGDRGVHYSIPFEKFCRETTVLKHMRGKTAWFREQDFRAAVARSRSAKLKAALERQEAGRWP